VVKKVSCPIDGVFAGRAISDGSAVVQVRTVVSEKQKNMIPIYAVIIVVFIAIQGFFTASEMAFTTVNRMRLRALVDSGDKKAIALMSFLEKEGEFLGTTLTGTNISVVISSVLATRIFAEYVGPAKGALLSTLCMVPITLVMAEIVPKMIAHKFSTDFALAAFVPIEGFHRLFGPVIAVLDGVARFMLRPFGGQKTTIEATLTKSDLRNIILMGLDTGGVDTGEVDMIHNILEFGSKNVGDIMVPLYRVYSIKDDDPLENVKELAATTGFSRIPVYRDNKNNIIGIINIYDIIFGEGSGSEAGLDGYVREVVTVSFSDGLDIALARLRHREQPMGVVLDLEGNVAGIITIEDILEEIVGDIKDSR
jgi:putative hemolysin